MNANTMKKDIENFHHSMLEAQRDLDAFTNDFNARLDGVSKELGTLPSLSEGLKLADGAPAAKLVNGEVDGWTAQLRACAKTAQETVIGRSFQNRFEKQPLVVVFGPVKAGKSTLGNFILGKALREAPFDNPYRSGAIPKAEIVVEESGRKDAKTKAWFDVNSIESTCSAQYFSVPGLVWVDTPGYGAVEKKGIDIRPLAEIARQYVNYADLVVFLDNSDAVWQREVSEAFKAVYTSGKKVLSAILRSDEPGQEEVVDGRIVERLQAKSERNRREQETYVRAGMRACGAVEADCEVISVSVKLAEEAIRTADEAKWEASGMGLFYRKIAEALGDGKVRELKKAAPRQLLRNAVKKVCDTIGGLKAGLKDVRERLQERYEALSPEGKIVGEIAEEAADRLRLPVGRAVDAAIARAEEKGAKEISVSMAELQEESAKAVNEVLSKAVKRIVGDYRRTAQAAFSAAAIQAGVTRGTDTVSYSVEVPDWEPRDPEGIWETICSWFGKEYTRATTRTVMRRAEVDLGFDGAAARRSLIAQFSEAAAKHVRAELQAIREEFFGMVLRKIDTLAQRVGEAEKTVAGNL